MRTDANGNPCPATLGEYRDFCRQTGIPNNDAVTMLEAAIAGAPAGREQPVAVSHDVMRGELLPRLSKRGGRVVEEGGQLSHTSVTF